MKKGLSLEGKITSNEKIIVDVLVTDEELEKAIKLKDLLKEAKTLADELAKKILID